MLHISLNVRIYVRGVTRGARGHNSPGAKSLWWAPKRPNNVTSTFLNTVHLLPKDRRFEHGDAKLVSFPGRHQTSLRPWFTYRILSQHLLSNRSTMLLFRNSSSFFRCFLAAWELLFSNFPLGANHKCPQFRLTQFLSCRTGLRKISLLLSQILFFKCLITALKWKAVVNIGMHYGKPLTTQDFRSFQNEKTVSVQDCCQCSPVSTACRHRSLATLRWVVEFLHGTKPVTET